MLRAHSDLHGGEVEAGYGEDGTQLLGFARPKRLVVAMHVLGLLALIANDQRIVRARPRPTNKAKAQSLSSAHTTLFPLIINDLPEIEHLHVLGGLAMAILALQAELVERDRVRRTRA